MGSLPNERLGAESVRDAVPASTPVPLKAMMFCGVELMLLVSVMAALAPTVVVGTKRTPTLQDAPAARLVPHVLEVTKLAALVPVRRMLPIVIAAPPVLVSTEFCEFVEYPTGSLPKDMVVADSDTFAVVIKPVVPETLES